MTFPRPLLEFVELFEAGRFWDSHEALEKAWREDRSDFYQALILYASAWVHWQRRNPHGVAAQLAKAHGRLSSYPDVYLGLDVVALREHCTMVSRSVSAGALRWADEIGPLPLALDARRVHGNEPELGKAVEELG